MRVQQCARVSIHGEHEFVWLGSTGVCPGNEKDYVRCYNQNPHEAHESINTTGPKVYCSGVTGATEERRHRMLHRQCEDTNKHPSHEWVTKNDSFNTQYRSWCAGVTAATGEIERSSAELVDKLMSLMHDRDKEKIASLKRYDCMMGVTEMSGGDYVRYEDLLEAFGIVEE